MRESDRIADTPDRHNETGKKKKKKRQENKMNTNGRRGYYINVSGKEASIIKSSSLK